MIAIIFYDDEHDLLLHKISINIAFNQYFFNNGSLMFMLCDQNVVMGHTRTHAHTYMYIFDTIYKSVVWFTINKFLHSQKMKKDRLVDSKMN